MIKTSLYLLLVSSGALWTSLNQPTLLDYYYAILIGVGIVYGARTLSFAYSGMMVLMAGVYAIENNSQIWQIDTHILSGVYFVTGLFVLIFKTDDGLNPTKIIAILLALKCFTSLSIDPINNGYLLHTLLNFLSIFQWVIFIRAASIRIDLNKSYTEKNNPFMLRVALTWNLLKTHSGITKGG